MANWTSPSQSSPKLEKSKKKKIEEKKRNKQTNESVHTNIFNNPIINFT